MENSASFELLTLSQQQQQQQAPSSSSSTTSATSTTTAATNQTKNAVSSCTNRQLLSNCTTLANNQFLPKLLYIILHNPRGALIGLVVLYVITLILWIPGYVCTYIVSEVGVYISILVSIQVLGKFVLVSLTFPGGSSTCQRIVQEIEREFMKYSLKVLEASTNCIKECGIALLKSLQQQQQQLKQNSSSISSNWEEIRKEMLYHRNKVLGMYCEILSALLEERQPQGSSSMSSLMSSSPQQDGHNDNTLLTEFGSNKLIGSDVGDLSDISSQAKEEGKVVLELLRRVCRDSKDVIDRIVVGCNNNNKDLENVIHSMIASANELRDYLVHMGLVSGLLQSSTTSSSDHHDRDDEDYHDDDDNNLPQHHPQTGSITGGSNNNNTSRDSMLSNVKTGWASLNSLLNPPHHTCIFGIDVLRGVLLSKYPGSKQIWVRRGRTDISGKIDAIFFPSQCSDNSNTTNYSLPKRKKIVLYCNPNAGMYEVATGFTGLPQDNDNNSNYQQKQKVENNWTDFYLSKGYDVMLFNYTCYGRSFTNGLFCPTSTSKLSRSNQSTLLKILLQSFLRIQPSPESLKFDAICVAKYILQEMKYENIIVHGESIGGMAASGVAKYFSIKHNGKSSSASSSSSLTTSLISSSTSSSSNNNHPISLLICDRTFCTLHSTAQYLLSAPWIGTVIRTITPLWNTDVANDYLRSTCSKIVANDSNDKIIIHPASLTSGLAYHMEYSGYPNSSTTIPFVYRLSDYYYDDSNLLEQFTKKQAPIPPVWPADKKMSLNEAYHFSACIRRIGKLATIAKRTGSFDTLENESYIMQNHFSNSSVSTTIPGVGSNTTGTNNSSFFIIQLWVLISSCDGLCGATLGQTSKLGFFAIVSWLSNCVVYGPQMIHTNNNTFTATQQQQEEYIFPCTVQFGVPIPQVLNKLKQIIHDETMNNNHRHPSNKVNFLFHEIVYISSVFEYLHRRLTSNFIMLQQSAVGSPLKSQHQQHQSNSNSTSDNVGKLLNLHCGHNNTYLNNEKDELWKCIQHIEKMREDDDAGDDEEDNV